MLAPQQEVEVDVRKEDQDRINEFGRNNSRLADVRDEIKALQDKLETLDDANTEVMMGEGDDVQLFIGESFVKVSEEYAQEYLEAQTEKTQAKVAKLQEEETSLESRQAVCIEEAFVRSFWF
ncbi:hypothetical protein THRCLA_22936 [Thraustotheca clavata]|uniref:Prefoldin subunit 4 n=1 Tax=Thraustotheca clavata TaxID=74557 RepID=A0A1V9YN01_9STRA|nr:hypothetical protein THRCLA_22936 [Thraustotheca clavata]